MKAKLKENTYSDFLLLKSSFQILIKTEYNSKKGSLDGAFFLCCFYPIFHVEIVN